MQSLTVGAGLKLTAGPSVLLLDGNDFTEHPNSARPFCVYGGSAQKKTTPEQCLKMKTQTKMTPNPLPSLTNKNYSFSLKLVFLPSR